MFKEFLNIMLCQKAVTTYRQDLQLLRTKQFELFLYVVQMAFEMSFFSLPELSELMLINNKKYLTTTLIYLFSYSSWIFRLFSNVEEQHKTLTSLMCNHRMCFNVVRMLQYKQVWGLVLLLSWDIFWYNLIEMN